MSKNKKIINIPDSKIQRVPHTREELGEDTKRRVSKISQEFKAGFEFIKYHPKSVTFFGSARYSENNKYYKKARSLAGKISKEGYAVVTGGGPGIMEGANRGACDENGHSIGFTIELPKEQLKNPYVNESVNFYYFFCRKVCLSFSAEAFIYFPGGFGTMDEFFEVVTLVQTHKIPPVPIILVGKEFWQPLNNFIENQLVKKFETVSKTDMKLYHITDDEDEVLSIIKKSPLRDE